MGTRGPVAKRDEERIRRNTPEVPTTTVSVIGNVSVPDLGFDAHPLVTSLYDSMKQSAQARFMEPSDWAYARLTMHAVNEMLTAVDDKGKKIPIGAMKLTAVNQMLSNLLLTEGDRRRVRLEIERRPDGPVATVTSIADVYREQLRPKPSN